MEINENEQVEKKDCKFDFGCVDLESILITGN